MIRGSKELIRSINCTNVLEHIINSEPISRAYLSKKLGLTKATISSIVQELINQKLVMEIGSDETKFGRKPILLSFNKKAGYAISIDLGNTLLSAALTDLKGDSAQFKRIQAPKDSQDIIPAIISLIESMKTLTTSSTFGIVGITIGIHGIVSDNNILYCSNYNFKNIDMKKEIEDYFHVPVYFETDANLSAIGEYTYKSTYASLANINIHDSITLGLVMDHTLYQGNSGFTGTIGHTIIEPNGKACHCGNHGCLEQYLSETVILKEYQKKQNDESLTLESLFNDYRNGAADAITVMEQFIFYSSLCINNVLNMYNPDIVVINSTITRAFPELLDKIKAQLTCHISTHSKIFLSKLDDSVLYGGICVGVKGFLHINHFVHAVEDKQQ